MRLFCHVFLWTAAVGCWVSPEATELPPVRGIPDDRADLVVIVVDSEGAPLSDAWVALAPGGRDARTDADGAAAFPNVGTGDWTATAHAAGRLDAEQPAAVGTDDATITIELAPSPPLSATLEGMVSDAMGEPVEGVVVQVDEGDVTAVTDAAGTWTVTGIAGGDHRVVLRPPTGSTLVTTDLGVIDVETGAAAYLAWSLPSGPPAGSRFVGSGVCAQCHPDVAATYEESPHARSGRSPEEASTDPDLADLAAAFDEGDEVDLGESVPGASLTLGIDADGGWSVTVTDTTGAATDPLPVAEIYGGHHAGAALAVEVGLTRALVPAAWALAGGGLSSVQALAGWVPSWTEGWFDGAGRLTLDADGAPGPEASFALRCAGCHATGAALAEQDGRYSLESAELAFVVESQVGCEACHDRGGAHTQAIDDRIRTVLQPARLHPNARVEVCARCHERTSSTVHPFADDPGWPVDAAGQPPGPLDPLAELALAAPIRWLGVPASRVGWDQVGDFRTSPHRTGPSGYLGACEDCHDPHGSEHPAGLRADPTDNTLCTTCHASRFPDAIAEADHTHHGSFDPGPWSPGACTGCHLPRAGVSVRPDAVSGAGELHSHTLTFALPELSLAEFDAAAATVLPRGSVPLPACLDCHLQADASAEDAGGNCPCPVGDPTRRETYEGLQAVFDLVWGSP